MEAREGSRSGRSCAPRLPTLLSGIVLMVWTCTAAAVDCAPAALQRELVTRNATDQRARRALIAQSDSREALDGVLKIDAENTRYMRQVLAQCGWPKRSIVGEEAAKAAWRLTQHADMDPEYQVLAARQLKYAVMAKEAESWDLAVLVDRNRRLNDQPQVYGMQFYTVGNGAIRFYDIITPAKLDARRDEVGLPSFYCWALDISRRNEGAPIEWPQGVLFAPADCEAR